MKKGKTKIRVEKNKYINSFWTFYINLNKDARYPRKEKKAGIFVSSININDLYTVCVKNTVQILGVT